jgi:hypothetical protein
MQNIIPADAIQPASLHPTSDATALVGLRIALERTIDVPCGECGQTSVVIGAGTGPHVASLHCASCNRHRGWLPKAAVNFLATTVTLFGKPAEPITISNSQFATANGAAPLGAIAASTSAP